MSAYFEYYKVFYYVARYHSITLAAEKLALTQPTVTRAIQNLEQQLGCRLFVRSRKGVELTSEGEMIYQRVNSACELLFSAEEDLMQAKSMNSGIVKLGVDDLFVRQSFLAPAIAEFAELYPNVRLRIAQLEWPELEQALASDTLDFCIISNPAASSGPFTRSKSLSMRALGDYPDTAIVGRKYAALAGGELTLAQLAELPLIASAPGTATRLFTDELFERRGIAAEPAVEVSSVDFRMKLVSLGLGCSFVPMACARDGIRSGELIPVTLSDCPLMREVMLMTSRTKQLSFAARRFLEIMQRKLNLMD